MLCWFPVLAALVTAASYVQAAEYRVVCYYGSWAVYRPGNGKFDVENIDPTLCTHLIYAFVGINTEGAVTILDSWNEIDKGALRRFNELKKISPSTKTMVAIGGWNAGSSTFSQVVNNDGLRAKFVDNIVNFVKQYGFDGFDLDWEYPTQRGGAETDKAAFAKLLSELRPKFDANGFILSAAVSAGKATIDPAYDVPALAKYLDFINVMTYDLHGSWDSATGENAPLYAGIADTTADSQTLNVDFAINYWIQKGASPDKLNVGMGTYGRSFTLQNTRSTDVGVAITGPGQAGPYTREAGTLGYNEICEQSSQWTVYWNEEQEVPYAVNGNQWVGYDNADSLKLKAQYVKEKGLGGAMIWSVETDDFLGVCGAGKFPLLVAINSVLTGKTSGIQQSTTQVTTAAPSQVAEPVQAAQPTAAATAAPAQPSGVCTRSGFVRDSSNCQVFYICENVNGQYAVSQFTCPAGTVFDTTLNVCNYPAEVQCS